jgi:protein-tyrosine-phosphatase/DNA-binding transcriptional ArsR family regulator
MNLDLRARRHAALGDTRRLLIVDALALGDLVIADLARLTELPGSLLAHHLDLLEEVGLVERRISEGDRRRRYATLRWENLPTSPVAISVDVASVAFVCTHNSARSQFAAALWERETGMATTSAGSHPSDVVHPKAVRAASEFGLDLSAATPGGYDRLSAPDLIVSVCDRAHEGGVPDASHQAHWSVPDPVLTGTIASFRSAFSEITERVEHLKSLVHE